jgi:hypothetical protein
MVTVPPVPRKSIWYVPAAITLPPARKANGISALWYPRLLNATIEQRSRWKVSGAGYGIHWPDIDEDLSTEGLLRGAPAAAEPARLGH